MSGREVEAVAGREGEHEPGQLLQVQHSGKHGAQVSQFSHYSFLIFGFFFKFVII